MFEANGFEDPSSSRERFELFKGLILCKIGRKNYLIRTARFNLNGSNS